MFQEVIMNTLETNWRIESLIKEKEDMKTQMEISELKLTASKKFTGWTLKQNGDLTEERITEPEDNISRNYSIWKTERKEKKMNKCLWDNNKRSNTHVTGVPEG